MLKKEFKEEDVNRLRNLVRGDYTSKTIKSLGYSKFQKEHKEGDIWEENDQEWTIKDGIKQNISKLSSAKELSRIPLFCPNCETIMKKRFDKDYFNIHKMCFDCVISFETELRRLGIFQEYHNKIVNQDIEGFINDFRTYVLEELKQDDQQHFSEAGELEKWGGGINNERVLESLDKTIAYLESCKK